MNLLRDGMMSHPGWPMSRLRLNRDLIPCRCGVSTMATGAMLWLLTCVIAVSGVAAETIAVVSDGVAVIKEGALSQARDGAIADALKQAVGQAIGLMVESTVLVENAQLVADRIHTKTRGYVVGYRVIREYRESELYRMTIDATVDRTQLSQDLEAMGVLYRRVGNPRFLVLVKDSFGGVGLPDAITETEVSRLLIVRGFEVVDQARVSAIREGEQASQLLKGNTKAAQLLGHQLGADILIVGDTSGAVAMRGGPLSGMVSVRSNLHAKAIRADTGVVLCSEVTSAAGIDLSEGAALRKSLGTVAGRWVDAGIPTLMDRWTKESGGASVVVLTLRGLRLDQVDQFIQLIRTKVTGVVDVRSRGFIDKVATVEVIGTATGETLERGLRRPDLQPFQLEINSVSPHRLDAAVSVR